MFHFSGAPLLWLVLVGSIPLLRAMRYWKWAILIWFPITSISTSFLYLAVASVLGVAGQGSGSDAGWAAMGAIFSLMAYGPFGILAVGHWWAFPWESFKNKTITIATIAASIVLAVGAYQTIYYCLTWPMVVEYRSFDDQPVNGLKVTFSVSSSEYGAIQQRFGGVQYTDKKGQLHFRVYKPESMSFWADGPTGNIVWFAGMDVIKRPGQADGTFWWENSVNRGEPIRNEINGKTLVGPGKPAVLYLMPSNQFMLLPPLREVDQLLETDFRAGLVRCTNAGSTTTLLLPRFEQLDRYLTENPPSNLQITSDLRSLLLDLDRACETWPSFDEGKWGYFTPEGSMAMRMLYAYLGMVPPDVDGLQQKRVLKKKIKEMLERLKWHEERYLAAKSARFEQAQQGRSAN